MLGPVMTSPRPRPRIGAGRASARGLSLLELMVGLAVGLFIVATALVVLTAHLRENRSLLLEARLMQDLRTTVELMSRQLRRAGHWGAPEAAMWQANAPVQANPYAALTVAGATADAVQFHASRDRLENHHIDSNETTGFRLQKGVIAMRLGDGGWQTLTDPAVLKVLDFQLRTEVQEQPLPDLCHRPCPTPSSTCPPRLEVRSLRIKVQGQAASDEQIKRSLQTQIRLRNDVVRGQCPA
jgi:prepilin peptidase dependent protein B